MSIIDRYVCSNKLPRENENIPKSEKREAFIADGKS